MPDQKQSQEQRISDASSQAPEQRSAPASASAPLTIDEREDEGWDQPESSAQKNPGQEQMAPDEGE